MVISLIEELRSRNALFEAIDGRDEITLLPILKFLKKYILDERYSSIIIKLTDIILEIYSPIIGKSQLIDKYFRLLRKSINEEIYTQENLITLKGILDTMSNFILNISDNFEYTQRLTFSLMKLLF
jgi:U3 small nucleolar RNA-associated protein 15